LGTTDVERTGRGVGAMGDGRGLDFSDMHRQQIDARRAAFDGHRTVDRRTAAIATDINA
jgi:hypothetical protein